jgi:hypothetical protein
MVDEEAETAVWDVRAKLLKAIDAHAGGRSNTPEALLNLAQALEALSKVPAGPRRPPTMKGPAPRS